MYVITLTQPWATLVAIGAKKLETRSRRWNYRGPVAVHAGASFGSIGGAQGLRDLMLTPAFKQALSDPHIISHPEKYLPFGAIVAVVDQVECYEIRPKGMYAHGTTYALPTEPERSFGNYTPGRFAYQWNNVRKLTTPLPWRGSQGVHLLPPEVVAQVMEQINAH